MRILRLADPDSQARSRTRLGESLIQLKSSDSPLRQAGVTPADQAELHSWHDRWHANQEQITRRLSLIEAELDRLVSPEPEPDPEGPVLAVFEGAVETASHDNA